MPASPVSGPSRAGKRPNVFKRVALALGLGLIALALVALAAPYLVGLYLAREHQSLVAGLALPPGVEVEIDDFERGWFRSSFTLELRAEGRPPLALDALVHHGPLPFTAGTGAAGLTPALAVVTTELPLVELLLGQRAAQPASVRLELELNGALTGSLHWPAAELQRPRGRLTMSEGTLNLNVPAGYRSMTLALRWPRLSLVADDGGQLEWRELQLDYHAASGAGGWGEYRLALDGLRFVLPQGAAVALEGLALEAAAGGKNPRLASTLNLRISAATFRGEDYGPLLLDGSLAVAPPPAWVFPGLAPGGLIALAALQTDGPWGGARNTRPSIAIERLLLGTPNGDVRVEAALTTVDVARGVAGVVHARVPVATMQNITAAVMRQRGSNAPPTAEEVAARIQQWLIRGFIDYVEADNAYTVAARIRGSQITINGRELENWQALFDRLFPQPR